jgi:hypothetical protein
MSDLAIPFRKSALALALLAVPALGHAQTWIKPGEENLLLSLGAVSGQINAFARIEGTFQNSKGTGIDLESDAGLGTDKTTTLIQGTWRFAKNHRLDGLYDEVKRDASKTTQRDYTIGDSFYPAGTRLSVEEKTAIGYLGYRYSFHKTSDMEVAGGLGLYGGNFKLKFAAEGPGLTAVDKSTTLPLPVLVLTSDFYLTDRATVTAALRGLKVKIGDVDGTVGNASLSGNYFFMNNVGVGAAIDYFKIKADVTKSDFRGTLEFKSTSAQLYLTARF